MSKQSGLGDRLYVEGVDLSGDVGAIQTIRGGHGVIDATGINSSGVERFATVRDGEISFNAYYNVAAGAAHLTLSPLPRTNVGVSYFRGHALGSPTATMTAVQVNYDPARGADGSLTATIQALSNHTTHGLLYGQMVDAGQRTDGSATTPTAGLDDLDAGVDSDFGATMWVHLIAFTGTSVTFTLRDAATEPTYANVTGGASSALTAAGYEVWSTSATQNIRRYLTVGTTGTFSNAVFAFGVARHLSAVL